MIKTPNKVRITNIFSRQIFPLKFHLLRSPRHCRLSREENFRRNIKRAITTSEIAFRVRYFSAIVIDIDNIRVSHFYEGKMRERERISIFWGNILMLSIKVPKELKEIFNAFSGQKTARFRMTWKIWARLKKRREKKKREKLQDRDRKNRGTTTFPRLHLSHIYHLFMSFHQACPCPI